MVNMITNFLHLLLENMTIVESSWNPTFSFRTGKDFEVSPVDRLGACIKLEPLLKLLENKLFVVFICYFLFIFIFLKTFL